MHEKMNQTQKNKLKSIIENEIESVNFDIEELEETTKPIPLDNAIGRVSRMDAINNKSRNEALLEDARSKLRNLEKSLSIIDTDEFGKCTSCGSEISFERLAFIPETTKCRNC